MTEPTETIHTERLPGPPLWRIGLVVAALGAVLASAALTMGASPAPSGGGSVDASTAVALVGNEEIGDWRAPAMGGRHGFGRGGPCGFGEITITAVSGSSISLKTEDGWTRTITVTDSTTISKGGQTIGLADLEVGDRVRIGQTRNDDGSFTVTALEVVVPHVGGTVTEVTASGFTLKDRDGLTWTITVNDATVYSFGSSTGSRSDVKVDVDVVVAGTQTSDSALTATSVTVAPQRVSGEVTAKSADTITVERRDGTTATIRVGSGTTYQVPGVTDASLSDITVGMFVAAEGTQQADGSLSATAVHGVSADQPGWGPGWGPGRGHGPGGWHGMPWGTTRGDSEGDTSTGA